MPKIVVCPLHAVPQLVRSREIGRVLGLLGADMPHPDLSKFSGVDHQRMTFHDISAPSEGLTPPGEADVQAIIDFIEDWDRRTPMLIHCFAGISRSTASSFMAMCLLRPDISEVDHAQALRERSRSATPNKLMIAHADRLLGRDGRMIEAVAAIGRGVDAFEGNIWEWQP